MNGESGGGDSPARPRRARPEVQIYRPGMLRKGTDITSNGSLSESNDQPPPREQREQQPREQRRPQLRQQRNEGAAPSRVFENSNRRRSGEDGGSGETTPDAVSVRGNSPRRGGKRGGRGGAGGAGGGAAGYDRSYNDRQSDYGGGGHGGYRNQQYQPNQYGNQYQNQPYQQQNQYDPRSQYSSRQSINSDDAYGRRYNGQGYGGGGGSSYNSTQSLYDTRAGVYLDSRGPQQGQVYGRGGGGVGGFSRPRFDRPGDRSSMRAEAGQRRQTGRRRNDSINSTQSERPGNVQDAHAPPSYPASETASIVGGCDFAAICSSLDSLGSFDWGEDIEREERERVEKEKKAACIDETTPRQSREEEEGRENTRPDRLTVQGRSGGGGGGGGARGAGGRRGGGRRRNDSDRSSMYAESIAEEMGEGEELADGERTPTESECSYGGRSGKAATRGRQNAYRGEHDYSREEAPPSRLQGRVRIEKMTEKERGGAGAGARKDPRRHMYDNDYSDYSHEGRLGGYVQSRVQQKMEGREEEQPRRRAEQREEAEAEEHQSTRLGQGISDQLKSRLTISVDAGGERRKVRDAASATSAPSRPVDVRDSAMASSSSKSMADYPIYHEIANNEGPQIKELNDEIAELAPRVAEKKDAAAAQQLVELSCRLSEIYLRVLTRDPEFTFAMGLEGHLRKQAFHKPIEAMRKAANSTRSSAKTVRLALMQLLDNGISFYARLFAAYERDLGISISDCLVWPSGMPRDDLLNALSHPLPAARFGKTSDKLAIKSLSRHLMALGDLHRYNTLVAGSEDYSAARSCYLKSSQLWPSFGHAYNQLAVVAYYSMLYRSRRRARLTPLATLSNQRQERVVDEMYYCMRAMAAGHPFEAARERLLTRLAAMRRKVEKYEDLLDKELGVAESERETIASLDRASELWLGDDGRVEEEGDRRGDVYRSLKEQQGAKLHRRTVSYVVHTVGLLVSKIGMERFTSVSERALTQLAALLEQPDSPMTAVQLVQIASMFIYAVHTTGIKGDSSVCSVQQQLSVRLVVSLVGVLLRPLLSSPSLQAQMDSRAARVLPALSLLTYWLTCPQASHVYLAMPTLEPLPCSLLEIDTWQSLAMVANWLSALDASGSLAKCDYGEEVVLPEHVFTSSFFSLFPAAPRTVKVDSADSDKKAVHARLRAVLTCVEFLDGSDAGCVRFNQERGLFQRSEVKDSEQRPSASKSVEASRVTVDDDDVSPSTARDLKSELHNRERRRRRGILVVRPSHVVADTNAFVDHLDMLEKLLHSGRFQLILPTVVLDELTGLSQNHPSDANGDSHLLYVWEQAKRAMGWIKERCAEKHPRMNTLTVAGKRLPISVVTENIAYEKGQVNDDVIVCSCVAAADSLPLPELPNLPSLQAEEKVVQRTLVLLTEDRGMNIKATSRQIPARTVPGFMSWAGLR